MKNRAWKKAASLVLAVSLWISLLSGCNSSISEENAAQTAVTEQGTAAAQTNVTEQGTAAAQTAAAEAGDIIKLTDQIGREVTLERPAEKIVSSYYISTAISVALGLTDKIAGVEMKADTRELYKKAAPELLELPAVGSGKGINVEETAALDPDVVILPKKLKDSVEQFEKLNIPVLVVDPETLDQYMECVTLIGRAAGVEEKASSLNAYYQEKMNFVQALTKDTETRPSVYLGAGSSYLSTCTSKMYQNDLIDMAGGNNVSSALEDGYWAQVSPEQILSWNPEYIFAVSYAEYTLDDIKNDEKLSDVQAVLNGNVRTFPSSLEPWDYPTPSSVLGILWLTHVLHPDLYTEDAYVQEAKSFYHNFFGMEVEEADLGL